MLSEFSYWPRTYLLVGVTAFLISVIGMPIAMVLLRKAGIIDAVADNKIHRKPVVRGGGIMIFIAFAVAVLLPGYRNEGMNGVLIGAFICLCVGALDDYTGGIPGFYKLLTLFAVTLILSYYEVRLNLFEDYPILNIALTMLWIVGVTSAFNGMDNMDGLSSGIAVIVSLMFFVIAMQVFLATQVEHNLSGLELLSSGKENRLSWFGLLAIGLVGSNLGFLFYNFHPAKIFMGDAGSFFLGFTLAALGVMGEWSEESRWVSCTIPILILGVPLFDFAYIIIARIFLGHTRTLREVIDHCAPDHLSHRLMWIGFSQRKAVLFIYLICVAMGVTGILLRNSGSLMDSELALFQGIAIVAIVSVLMTAAKKSHIDSIQHEKDRLNHKDTPEERKETLET